MELQTLGCSEQIFQSQFVIYYINQTVISKLGLTEFDSIKMCQFAADVSGEDVVLGVRVGEGDRGHRGDVDGHGGEEERRARP